MLGEIVGRGAGRSLGGVLGEIVGRGADCWEGAERLLGGGLLRYC